MSSTNGYPFATRREILAKIASDRGFVAECMATLQARYEARGAGTSSMGWMASHASKAVALAAKVAAGEASDKEMAEAAKLAARYSKQLARALRDRDLAARPELGAQAAVFGVGGGEQSAPAIPAAIPESGESAPVPKKRGRPKGSKNRPKDSPKPTRRRRA